MPLTRYSALFLLALFASLVHAAAPVYSGIDEVELSVRNPESELAFYRRLFGGEVVREKQGGKVALQLGESVLVLSMGNKAQASHTAFAVKSFVLSELQEWFRTKALTTQSIGTSAIAVTDRDGTRTLIKTAADWSDWKQRGTLEAANATEPLFHPEMIDEVYITVTNLEVDALHYARLIGKTGSLQAGSLWFAAGTARLRLGQTPVRQKPGFQSFAILVSSADLETAADAVFKAGGIIENVLPNGFSFWDPEGLRVEVHLTPQLGQKPQPTPPLK